MAQTNVASAVALISLDGAAAPILTQILTVNALFPSRRALVPLLDGRSLARLNACARAFGKRDETGRSFCENVARERVFPLMRAHLGGGAQYRRERRTAQPELPYAVLRVPSAGGRALVSARGPHDASLAAPLAAAARLRNCSPRLRCLRSRTGGRVGRRERRSSVGRRGHADLPAREPAAGRCRGGCRPSRPARCHPRAAGPLRCHHIHTNEHSCRRRGSICARRKPGGLFLGVGPDVGIASPREKAPRARDLPESQARLRSATPVF